MTNRGQDLATATLDSRRLRALAHPLRVRLLGMLRLDGPATATELGKRSGENSANTSWHLRQLADVGLVVEDTERGTKRERWWKAAHEQTTYDKSEFVADPQLAAPITVFLHALNAVHHEHIRDFLTTAQRWSPEWRAAADLSDHRLSLTHEELEELNSHIQSLVDRYRRRPEPGDAEVLVHWHAVPLRPVEHTVDGAEH